MSLWEWMVEHATTLATIAVGLISGTVSVTRRMLTQRKLSKLWLLSEYAGIALMIAIAMDMYPIVKPTLLKMGMHWMTEWLFVATAAFSGSRLMWSIERKLTAKIKE